MRILVSIAYNAVRLFTWPLAALWRRLRGGSARWVLVRLRGGLEELPRPRPLLQRLLPTLRPEHRSVAELRKLCARLADDPRAVGLVVELEHLHAGYPSLASLGGELTRLRAAGKQVVCYLPQGGEQRELYVAASADRVFVMPHAGLSALGPAAARTYVAPLLARLGVQIAVTAEGRFKTAAEPLVRESMSEPERAQLDAIVATLHDEWVAAVGTRPQLGPRGAEGLLQVGLFGAQHAVAQGLVDGCRYEDELRRELGLQPGEQPVVPGRYLSRRPRPLFVPLRPRPRIALVRLSGAIGEREAGGGIALRATTALLRRLARLDQVAGVLLHIDSPGGSALVSELLHREIRQLDARKPVVAWLGEVAASGGYYLASGCRAIVAHPTTLTGSIGVISVRPIVAKLFELIGMRREVVSRTPFADLHTIARALSPAEDALLRAETARFYDRFLEVVALGRKRTVAEIAGFAEGRVWSGRDAAACGLVDRLGGYHEARAELTALVGEGGAKLADEPLLLAPPRAAGATPFPRGEPAKKGALSHDLGPLIELVRLAQRGERIFTYALGLPRIE